MKINTKIMRTAALAFACAMAASTGTAGLIAHYEFEGDLTDSAGTRDGSFLNVESSLGSGSARLGNGFLTVDTTGDAGTQNVGFQSGGAPFMLGGGERTIAFFVRSTGVSSGRPTFFSLGSGTGANTGQRFDLTLAPGNPNDGVRIEVNGNGATGGDLTSIGTNLLDGQWHHIAVRTAANPSLDDVEIFINGASIGTVPGGADPNLITADSALVIGDSFALSAGANLFRGFTGDFDDFRVYDMALSNGEIASLAQGIPEPSTFVLLAASVAGCWCALRQRSR
jgi:hypothetical protein